MEHTAGPWKWHGSYLITDGYEPVIDLKWNEYGPPETIVSVPNACLIAAAPLLYEAMQHAVDEEGIDDLGQLAIGPENTARILTALRIARGETE